MVLTSTALVQLFGSFVLSILAYRFYQTYRETEDSVSRFFFYFVSIFAFYFFFDGLGILFFAYNSLILKLSVFGAIFFQSLACAVTCYLVFYFLFPKINPWFGFLFVCILGLGVTILAFKTPFSPFLDSAGAIKFISWNVPLIIGFLQFLIFFITFIPLACVFLLYSKISKKHFLKIRSLAMMVVVLLGLNAAFIVFFLQDFLKLHPLTGDIALGIFGLFLFLFLLYASFQPKN